MAEKKVVLLACGEADVAGKGAALEKFMKKACSLASFKNENVLAEVAKIEGAVNAAADGVAKALEDGAALVVVELGNADADALEAAMAHVSEAADRRTLVAIATDKGLFLGGLGINKKAGAIDRAACVCDLVATFCYVADLPVPADCIGGVLYQALKDPNMKAKEIGKLKDAIARMEVAMQRDSREPWDKHDCA
ncbi:hypothetical protein [Halodesulfovibrio sp.]|jgi:hypothetical protein|uniref:hypothetical protein n=1 Tax=Halodesulfovibrio sp. TaxID=1912772 RepID=UPI0025E35913|nr:hypothetical protein [Halodesulfovibrio sp.]MCT4535901.1 hypothetical protein [Halodesulfovibrio sp.]MCT4626388.1 hypothetical protein [Halodesulfovibrio sp.]